MQAVGRRLVGRSIGRAQGNNVGFSRETIIGFVGNGSRGFCRRVVIVEGGVSDTDVAVGGLAASIIVEEPCHPLTVGFVHATVGHHWLAQVEVVVNFTCECVSGDFHHDAVIVAGFQGDVRSPNGFHCCFTRDRIEMDLGPVAGGLLRIVVEHITGGLPQTDVVDPEDEPEGLIHFVDPVQNIHCRVKVGIHRRAVGETTTGAGIGDRRRRAE